MKYFFTITFSRFIGIRQLQFKLLREVTLIDDKNNKILKSSNICRKFYFF